MTPRPLIAAIVVATLSLSGCALGDGIAHVVKLASQSGKSDSGSPSSSAPQPNAEPAGAVDDGPPPPAPAPAPRDSIKVEQLPPR